MALAVVAVGAWIVLRPRPETKPVTAWERTVAADTKVTGPTIGVSPDGKWFVVSVVEPSYDPKDQVSDLWIGATDGSSAPRRVTQTKSAESSVTWLTGGTSLRPWHGPRPRR